MHKSFSYIKQLTLNFANASVFKCFNIRFLVIFFLFCYRFIDIIKYTINLNDKEDKGNNVHIGDFM